LPGEVLSMGGVHGLRVRLTLDDRRHQNAHYDPVRTRLCESSAKPAPRTPATSTGVLSDSATASLIRPTPCRSYPSATVRVRSTSVRVQRDRVVLYRIGLEPPRHSTKLCASAIKWSFQQSQDLVQGPCPGTLSRDLVQDENDSRRSGGVGCCTGRHGRGGR
jgi:hypothetical protein